MLGRGTDQDIPVSAYQNFQHIDITLLHFYIYKNFVLRNMDTRITDAFPSLENKRTSSKVGYGNEGAWLLDTANPVDSFDRLDRLYLDHEGRALLPVIASTQMTDQPHGRLRLV